MDLSNKRKRISEEEETIDPGTESTSVFPTTQKMQFQSEIHQPQVRLQTPLLQLKSTVQRNQFFKSGRNSSVHRFGGTNNSSCKIILNM